MQVLVTQAVHINRLTLEAYADEPEPLDLEWYLVHQVVQTVHPIASLINWGPRDTADGRLYCLVLMMIHTMALLFQEGTSRSTSQEARRTSVLETIIDSYSMSLKIVWRYPSFRRIRRYWMLNITAAV